LESLYASCNRIRDIRPIHNCRELHTLSLYANLLSSLEACMESLSGLPHLGELDLGNNPLSFAGEYRHMVCLSLGKVSMLDGDKVSVLDRDLACHYYNNKVH